eukprot:scaffold259024_cov15-Tisochrysis_lutea.AAC.1
MHKCAQATGGPSHAKLSEVPDHGGPCSVARGKDHDSGLQAMGLVRETGCADTTIICHLLAGSCSSACYLPACLPSDSGCDCTGYLRPSHLKLFFLDEPSHVVGKERKG